MAGKLLLSRKSIFGLDAALDGKVNTSDVVVKKENVLSATDPKKVPSVVAISSIYNELNEQIENAKNSITSLIDDTAASGSNKTWSIDKIKQFVSSVDDTVVVQNISERDALAAYDSLVAFVIDTKDDKNLDESLRGKPFSYIYANGKWYPLSPVGEVDSTVFVKTKDVVTKIDANATDTTVPSALATYNFVTSQATAVANQTEVRIVSEIVTVGDNNKAELTVAPKGDLVGNSVEVVTDKGILLVEATVSGTELTINDSDDYKGKNVRVSYLANNQEYLNALAAKNNNNSSDNSSSDNSSSDNSSSDNSSNG